MARPSTTTTITTTSEPNTNSTPSEYDLNAYLPPDIRTLTTTTLLSRAIALKAAAIYPFYLTTATMKIVRKTRCEACRARKNKCHHNTLVDVGTLAEVQEAATQAFHFFINEYNAQTFDIVGSARVFLSQRKVQGRERECCDLLVEMVMGIVGVIHAFLTGGVQRKDVEIEELEARWNTLPKGTDRVMVTAVGYAGEVEEWVWVFERLISAVVNGEGPDGREGDLEGVESGLGEGVC